MNRTAIAVFLTQSLLTVCAIIIAVWGKLPPIAVVGITLLAGNALAAATMLSERWERTRSLWIASAWLCTLIIPGALWVLNTAIFTFDYYHAAIAGLESAVILGTSFRVHTALKTRWKKLAVVWAFSGSIGCVAVAYSLNESVLFHIGLLLTVGLLVLCKYWFQVQALGILIANTVILLLIGLPVVDFFVRPAYRLELRPEQVKNFYSYEAAKKDPQAFAAWWYYFVGQMNEMGIGEKDPDGIIPWRLKAGSQGRMFDSRFSVNRKGFRGPEIAEEKGNIYRIVAIGESTTFGFTINVGDRPWPEMLEERIRQNIQSLRPVEVINAGIPAFTIKNNLARLQRDILPLKPDMIISYHGFNGFNLINKSIPKVTGRLPPKYRQRPLKLLGDCEYRLKMILYRRKQVPSAFPDPSDFGDVMNTEYARAYDELIRFTETNHIQLVLANFSMAVNDRSDSDVIEFYRAGFGGVYWHIHANTAHSRLVKQIAEHHPEILFVDTHPHLDGEHEKFLDLVHPTQSGNEQLAETFFGALKEPLEKKLSAAH